MLPSNFKSLSIEPMSSSISTGRMNYLDAVRGFSMFLVVVAHVLFKSLNLIENESYLNNILATFRMPMFFFVSGIVAYKSLDKWTAKNLFSILKRKFQAQIIGTIFFYTILLLAIHNDDPFKAFRLSVGGYWFTLALFRVFLIYSIIVLLFRKSNNDILVFTTLGLISLIGTYLYYNLEITNIIISLIGHHTLYFLQFFLLGLIFKRYVLDKLDSILKRSYLTVVALLFISFLLLSFSYEKEVKEISESLYFIINSVIVRYLGLLLVFGLFFINRAHFENGSRINKIWLLIGRRTLDIYFIHYFFLPDLTWMKKYMIIGWNDLIPQLIISFFFAAIIIAVCLGISYVMRLNGICRKWLFGMKN